MKFVVYQILYALGFLLACLCLPFSRKLRQGVLGRKGLVDRVRALRDSLSEAPFWFHVASSGELEQVFPILDEIKKRSPDTPLFVTCFSPTGFRAIWLEVDRRKRQGREISWDAVDFSPYDFFFSANRFVEALRPRQFIAVHREVWPGILHACAKAGVPRSLFAAYLPENGKYGHLKDVLALFNFSATTEPGSAEKLRELGVSNVECLGDPRIERVLARKELRGYTGEREDKTLLLASLWPEDLLALKSAVRALLNKDPAWRLVIVPHEPTPKAIEASRRWANDVGVNVSIFSEKRTGHVIVDGVGFLAELYECASLVFVGGSFRAKVHNVLEPAAYGCPIVTGPFIQNSGEAVELAKEGALYPARDAAELEAVLLYLAGNAIARANRSRVLGEYLTARRGAAAHYADRLLGAV